MVSGEQGASGDTSSLCAGRVAVVTGAGRGIGRAHALALAQHGAAVVVNDLDTHLDGSPSPDQASAEPGGAAARVVAEITAAGGQAVANTDDVADWEGAQRLINTAIETFGRLDVVVNNAGILRDRVLANMTEGEWDAVIRTHLKGTFAPARWAAAHWRERAKAGAANDARIINTTSVSGLYGNPGQANYGAAKAGIAAFTQITAAELGRYGVTVNAVAPVAITRMNEGLAAMAELTEAEREEMSTRRIAQVVTWLASPHGKDITGRVFEASAGWIAVAEGWHRGPVADAVDDDAAVGPVLAGLVARARPDADLDGQDQP